MDDLRTLAKEFAKTMGCNCDLDNWEPERTTGHSHVCRIHQAAVREYQARAYAKRNQQSA